MKNYTKPPGSNYLGRRLNSLVADKTGQWPQPAIRRCRRYKSRHRVFSPANVQRRVVYLYPMLITKVYIKAATQSYPISLPVITRACYQSNPSVTQMPVSILAAS